MHADFGLDRPDAAILDELRRQGDSVCKSARNRAAHPNETAHRLESARPTLVERPRSSAQHRAAARRVVSLPRHEHEHEVARSRAATTPRGRSTPARWVWRGLLRVQRSARLLTSTDGRQGAGLSERRGASPWFFRVFVF